MNEQLFNHPSGQSQQKVVLDATTEGWKVLLSESWKGSEFSPVHRTNDGTFRFLDEARGEFDKVVQERLDLGFDPVA